MKNKTELKIAEAVIKSAPRFTDDAELLIFQIARDLNLESLSPELALCRQMVNDAIKLCKQGKGSDLKKNFIK